MVVGFIVDEILRLSMGKGTSWSQNSKFTFLHNTVVEYHKINV